MRIGIDIKAFKNGSTGIARYLKNLMDCLQQIDHVNEYFLFECSPSNYEVHNRKWKKILTPWKLPGILWQQFILPFQLRKYSIDIIWAPEQIAPVLYRGGAKIITTVHDLVVYRYPESCQKSNLYIQKILFPLTLKKSEVVIPVSQYVKNELLIKFKFFLKSKELVVINNAGPYWTIPTDYSPFQRQNYLLCVGNIEPRKNIVTLIKAFEKVKNVDLRLVIVGPKGWKNTDFFHVVESSKKKEKIEIQGYITEEELKKHYLSCKALIYPSLYEGFGIPILEAISMDCPILTSKNSVMQEIANDAADYFDPFSSDEIAEKIEYLIHKKVFNSENNSKRVKKYADKYSWNKSALQLYELWGKTYNKK